MSRRLRRGCIAAFMRFVSFTVWEGTEVLSLSVPVDIHRIHGMVSPCEPFFRLGGDRTPRRAATADMRRTRNSQTR
ncbi:hypothetical protein EDB92DRAFT_1901835 [Lactarius akahatsu]|uniref:Secreted protein n=1 Tax=Lactarius akahatsu TaxID=416441 RepID=A0AAD4L7I1_9AGAM|nr:hypothetical protein EDB92DRAFT_1901835 [Lactarius akahatsu]